MKKGMMIETCNIHGENEEHYEKFCRRTRRKDTDFEVQGCGNVNWIHQAQDTALFR